VIGANVSGNAAYATNAGYANSAGTATNASFATNATHANKANTVAFTARDANDTTDYIAFVDTATAGDKALFADTNLTYNSSNNVIGANISGNAAYATNAGYANSATHANKANAVKFTARDSNDVTDYIAFVDTATAGDKALFTDANLTYNPANNVIGANISGDAAYANSAGSATNASFATSATHANQANAVKFTARNATDTTDYIAFVDTADAGDKALFTDTNLTYNPANNVIGANISGNAAYAANAGFATSATHANAANAVKFTARDAIDNTDYIAFVDTATAGDKALFTDANLTYNSSNNHLNANVPYANNAGTLDGASKSTAANANSIVQRDGSKDIACRLLRPNFNNQNDISGAMAFRINNSNDNYVRFCSNTGSIRTFLNVPTRTGGDASGTWSINVNGSAANISSSNATMPAYIKHAGDTNTYFGFPGNDTYIIGTNGAERLRITSGGNVGIGTTNPSYPLSFTRAGFNVVTSVVNPMSTLGIGAFNFGVLFVGDNVVTECICAYNPTAETSYTYKCGYVQWIQMKVRGQGVANTIQIIKSYSADGSTATITEPTSSSTLLTVTDGVPNISYTARVFYRALDTP
jgi:uncharacterized protein (UPF0297 family)